MIFLLIGGERSGETVDHEDPASPIAEGYVSAAVFLIDDPSNLWVARAGGAPDMAHVSVGISDDLSSAVAGDVTAAFDAAWAAWLGARA